MLFAKKQENKKDTSLKREILVYASGLDSIYKSKIGEILDVRYFQEGSLICKEMFDALKLLNEKVKSIGGKLNIVDLNRSWDKQQEARTEYEQVCKDGKKAAYVALPGASFHGSGHAADISMERLNFPNIPKKKWIEVFWSLSKPLGFRPIIKIPSFDISENWHYDYPTSTWSKAYDTLSYDEVAKACCLDVGSWNPLEDKNRLTNMFIQSQLIRLGYYEIGTIDGFIGPKTMKTLEKLNLHNIPLEDVVVGLKLL
jgi:hypothetical protein